MSLTYQQSRAKRWHGYPVLTYHGCVLVEADRNTYWEYIEDFKSQVSELKRLGYVFVKPSVYMAWRNGTYNPPRPIAVIRIDDGLDIMSPMADWLVSQNIPFGIALISRRQGKKTPESGFISWASVLGYVNSAAGAEVMCHTYNSHSLSLIYDADSATVGSSPILEGPWYVDAGMSLHSDGVRPAWDWSYTDDAWLLPMWGLDPYDGTTRIITSVTFTPASSFSLGVIRMLTNLTRPIGVGYAVQIGLTLTNSTYPTGVSCGTVTIHPKNYGTRSQWPEREFISVAVPSPHTINSGEENTLTFTTLNDGAFMMGIFMVPDASGDVTATTNCQSLVAGVAGPANIDRPAGADYTGRPIMILGDGTGSTVSDGTFTTYVQGDIEAFQASVQDWLKATWTFLGNPQDKGDADQPCFGTQSSSALTTVFEVLIADSTIVDLIQIHMTSILGAAYAAQVEISVGTTPTGSWTQVFKGAAQWIAGGVWELNCDTFTTSGPITYVQIVTTTPCPAAWGTDNYSRIVFDSLTLVTGNPQVLGDSDIACFGTQSSAALTTIHHVVATPGVLCDLIQLHLTTNTGSSYATDIKISVGPTSSGSWTQVYDGPAQWIESDVSDYHVDFFTATADTYVKIETVSTSGTNNYSHIVREGGTTLPWIKFGTVAKPWIKFGTAAKTAADIPTHFVEPFGADYSADSGSFFRPNPSLRDIAPPLKTALIAGGCNCGYTITPLMAGPLTELADPDVDVSEWNNPSMIVFGTAAASTTLQHQAVFAGMEWPDTQHGGVIWSTAMEPNVTGNATLRRSVNIFTNGEVHFDSWYPDAAGHIVKQAMNDGGTYLSTNGSTQVGDFTIGETITGGTSGATATIVFNEDLMKVTMLSGTFVTLETITGGTSGAHVQLDETAVFIYANDKAFLQSAGVPCYLIFNNLPDGEPDSDLASYVVNHSSDYIPLFVGAVVDEGYDGMMFDLEAIPPADNAATTSFIQALYAALHAVDKKLCVVMPLRTGTSYDTGTGNPSGDSTDWWGAYDHVAVIHYCDSMVILSYLENSGTLPGAACPDTIFNLCYSYLNGILPADQRHKVRVGCNAYGTHWPDKTSAANTEYNSYYIAIANLLNGATAATIVDTEAHSEGVAGDAAVFATPLTVQRAVNKALADGWGGIFVWKAGDASQEFWPRFIETTSTPIFPTNLYPMADSYTVRPPAGSVSRIETSLGSHRYMMNYDQGVQQFDVTLRMDSTELVEFMDYYHFDSKKGTIPSTLPLDSWRGMEPHPGTTIVPETLSTKNLSDTMREVTFTAEAVSTIYTITATQAQDYITAYEALYTAYSGQIPPDITTP